MEHMDIFNDDAFSLVSMVAAINDVPHVPGRAGQLAFAGVGEGVATTTVTIEKRGMELALIKTSPRGGPAPKAEGDKANLRAVNIPHVKLEDTIGAHEIQGVRAFGSPDLLVGAQNVVNGRLNKIGLRHDLTLEFHRLGALRGIILDSDGSTLTNLFELFGLGSGPVEYDLDLDELASEQEDLRVKCQKLVRYVYRKAGTVIPSSARPWVFCGDNFFDKLVSREDVKKTFTNTDEQRVRLGANYAFGAFEYGGIVWENYRGTDDGQGANPNTVASATVGIAPDEARLFLTGVPGLYAEYFAPADFMETVNTIGLPRYAKLAPDAKFNRFVEVHTQQNPLPICLRPQTLLKLV